MGILRAFVLGAIDREDTIFCSRQKLILAEQVLNERNSELGFDGGTIAKNRLEYIPLVVLYPEDPLLNSALGNKAGNRDSAFFREHFGPGGSL